MGTIETASALAVDQERHDQIVAEVVERYGNSGWDARDQGRLAFADGVSREDNPHDRDPLRSHDNAHEWHRGWDYEHIRKEHGRRIRDWCSNRFPLADEALFWEDAIIVFLVYRHNERDELLALPIESIHRRVSRFCEYANRE